MPVVESPSTSGRSVSSPLAEPELVRIGITLAELGFSRLFPIRASLFAALVRTLPHALTRQDIKKALSKLTFETSRTTGATPRSPAAWKSVLEKEIRAYSQRGPGWDGYSAEPIHPRAIQDAIDLIDRFPDELKPPIDQPHSDGHVSLVWRKEKAFAEVGFPGDGTFWWYCTDGSQEASGEHIPVKYSSQQTA